MLIRNAVVFGSNGIDVPYADVRLVAGRIQECGTNLRPLPGEDDLDAHGGWLLPGLHDHHIHLRSLAATADSVPFGPPQVDSPAGFAERLRCTDCALPPGVWIRGVGYHVTVAGDLDRWTLDQLLPDRPIRIQHRSGALWILNSRACAEVGADDCPEPGIERDETGRVTGRFWRMDAWLGARISSPSVDVAWVAAQAAAHGITGFTDATPALRETDIADLAQAVTDGRVPQRLHCMTPPGITDPGVARMTLGPTKILLDDTTLPPFDEFTDTIRQIHVAGKAVAVHCVTRVQLVLTMAALDAAGVRVGDRIEHGAIIPAESMSWLRERGVPVVTQPHFPLERAAQYAREVEPADRPDLWRLASLLAAGVGVAAGTDAPFGGADPWPVVHAACTRDRGEQIPLRAALSLFFGTAENPARARVVALGEVADLTLLRVSPGDVGHDPSADLVAATIVNGVPIYLA